ncbi:hypothetical protein [Legionella spiritensis]|uniref:hypothetical protein n=1 Tax=Legionella spiritensis TaxID=452 RepID=UPI000F84B0C0|nr:hypothetical protein [Legionella spiritensis]
MMTWHYEDRSLIGEAFRNSARHLSQASWDNLIDKLTSRLTGKNNKASDAALNLIDSVVLRLPQEQLEKIVDVLMGQLIVTGELLGKEYYEYDATIVQIINKSLPRLSQKQFDKLIDELTGLIKDGRGHAQYDVVETIENIAPYPSQRRSDKLTGWTNKKRKYLHHAAAGLIKKVTPSFSRKQSDKVPNDPEDQVNDKDRAAVRSVALQIIKRMAPYLSQEQSDKMFDQLTSRLMLDDDVKDIVPVIKVVAPRLSQDRLDRLVSKLPDWFGYKYKYVCEDTVQIIENIVPHLSQEQSSKAVNEFAGWLESHDIAEDAARAIVALAPCATQELLDRLVIGWTKDVTTYTHFEFIRLIEGMAPFLSNQLVNELTSRVIPYLYRDRNIVRILAVLAPHLSQEQFDNLIDILINDKLKAWDESDRHAALEILERVVLRLSQEQSDQAINTIAEWSPFYDMALNCYDARAIVALATCVSQAPLDKLVKKVIGWIENINSDIQLLIEGIAPFLSKEQAYQMVSELNNHYAIYQVKRMVASLAPHLSQEQLDSLVDLLLNQLVDEDKHVRHAALEIIASIVNRLSQEQLDQVVGMLTGQLEGKYNCHLTRQIIKEAAPGLSQELADILVNQLTGLMKDKGECVYHAALRIIKKVAPRLSQVQSGKLVDELSELLTHEDIIDEEVDICEDAVKIIGAVTLQLTRDRLVGVIENFTKLLIHENKAIRNAAGEVLLACMPDIAVQGIPIRIPDVDYLEPRLVNYVFEMYSQCIAMMASLNKKPAEDSMRLVDCSGLTHEVGLFARRASSGFEEGCSTSKTPAISLDAGSGALPVSAIYTISL